MLVDHCTTTDPLNNANLFGSLLEAAAHCGADLSSLVARIPEVMAIEGLRPKLIAAVTDYRHKVKIHEYVAEILTEDKVFILRELSHLSRRGTRIAGMRKTNMSTRHKSDQLLLRSTKRSLLETERVKTSVHISNTFSLSIR